MNVVVRLILKGIFGCIALALVGINLPVLAQKIEVPSNSEAPPAIGKRVFADVEGGYEIELDNGWRTELAVENNGRRLTEIIFRDRSYALLKVKKEKAPDEPLVEGDLVKTLITHEMENDLRFRPDYKFVSQERFVNSVARGALLQFTYKRVGKLMTGRYYYLQTTPDTVWVLRFIGEKTYLDPFRYQTDQLARSFKPLP